MSHFRHCSNQACPNYSTPRTGWYVHIGSYHTIAHGEVSRVRCKACGRTISAQTYSIHYFAKRRLPLVDVFRRLRGGSSQRDIARTLHVSRTAIRSAVYRLGRQAMAAQVTLVGPWLAEGSVVFDGLQSSLTSKDFPCHITTAVAATGEVVLDMTHTVLRRGGVLRPAQEHRRKEKEAVWRPRRGSLTKDISLLVHEIPRFHRMPNPDAVLVIDTDEHPVYQAVIAQDRALRFWKTHGLFEHRRTPGSAPRTTGNRLFPVNYLDRLMRHRLKEHTRQTIAFGRHAVDQMHRAWIMMYDHNVVQPWRVKDGDGSACHAAVAGIDPGEIARIRKIFFRDRIDMRGVCLTGAMRKVWEGQLDGPPVRWKVGQVRAAQPRIPRFALREAARCTQGG